MKKTKFYIKIRPTISFILIALISSVIVVTLSLNYYFSKELAFSATKEKFDQISQKVEQKVKETDKRNNDIISIFELYKASEETALKNKRHPLLPLLTTTLNNNPYIYALYVGNKNGNFYEVINLEISKKLEEKYKKQKDERWLIIKIYEEEGKRVQYEEFLNKNLEQVRSIKKEAIYNPSLRPWFLEALKNNDIIKTKPYMYINLEAKGITYAKAIKNSNSVFGIDISLESINNFLSNQVDSKSQLFLFKNTQELIASINYSFKKNENPNLFPYKEILKVLNKQKVLKENIIKIDNIEYFLYFSKIDSKYSEKEDLVILTPIENIMYSFTKKIYYSFFITIVILTFTIPLIWYSTKILVNPIHKLAKENEKIINRNFEKVENINTNIKELHELSNSLVNMSNSLKEYENKQKELMDSFIKLLANAIDAKSKYTGGHCERVPILTMLLAKKASECKEGIFKEFELKNEEEKRELSVAAWLHDCGKITTPEYVVDKATKLETIYNRIHEIRTRFEVIHRDITIKMYENILNGANETKEKQKAKLEQEELIKEFEAIAKANIGSEFMTDEDIEKIKEISKRTWIRNFDNTIGLSNEEKQRLVSIQTPKIENLLSDKLEHLIKRDPSQTKEYDKYNFKIEVPEYLYNLGEIYNLTIKKGTLNTEERFKINEHMAMTIIMLEQLPFPEGLKKVPEYAGAHHETLIGTGYPRKLTKEQMSIPARIMAVADIFEALTASDRPYKDAKTLSESIKILSFMEKDKHIDEDIFKLFLTSGAYKEYALKYLKKEQIDEVDISKYI